MAAERRGTRINSFPRYGTAAWKPVWWTYSFSAIEEDAAPNGVGGVMVICRDVTVPCPAIIDRLQLERVAATRATRNPRKIAPHVAAGTTLLSRLARCGMPGCGSA